MLSGVSEDMIHDMELLNGFIAQNLPLFGFIGFLAGAFLYWRTGGMNVSKNIIENFKTRVDQLEKDVIRLTKQHQDNVSEIGRLNGVISEKDKYISLLKEVSLDRNPEMKQFVEMMTQATKRNEQRDDRIIKALEGLEKHLAPDGQK